MARPCGLMVLLDTRKLALSVALNQAHRFRVAELLRRLARRRPRGGVRWSERSVDANVAHVLEVFDLMRKSVGDPAGKVAVEIGPGDNAGVAYCFLKAGCSKVLAIEQFTPAPLDEPSVRVLRALDRRAEGSGATVDEVVPRRGDGYAFNPARLEWRQEPFGDARIGVPVDFIYSNDALEHVASPAATLHTAYGLLAPGGLFAGSVDLSGHNAFTNPERPLDFLSCDDRLWRLMTSHIATTNRVRFSELLQAAKDAGFEIVEARALLQAARAYLASVRPHLLPRYQALADDDLAVVQCLVVARKPST
jgi:hypothetical protein